MTRPQLSEALLRVRIPQGLKIRCEAAAHERALNLSEFVRDALEESLKNKNDPPPIDVSNLLKKAEAMGVYEVVFRTQPRPRRSKQGDPAGR
jgi:hypothetical protein